MVIEEALSSQTARQVEKHCIVNFATTMQVKRAITESMATDSAIIYHTLCRSE